MKKYRCPYCGEEAFSLRIKLGITTKFGRSPRCPKCKRVVFRSFLIGGHFLYGFPLLLVTILFFCGIIVSENTDSAIGMILSFLLFNVLYLVYNYYFCYFDRIKKEGSDEIIYLQLKKLKNSWPDIRKGEIYVVGLLKSYDFASSRDGFITAMLENKTKDKLQLRVLAKPPAELFELKGEVVIYCGSARYAATVI